jgi:t-SNARE complex subunit (syntaxin)
MTEIREIYDEDMLYARDTQIKELHQEMKEINMLYSDILDLITSQAPIVDTIEDNILSTKENTSLAKKELQKADKKHKKNNKYLILGISVTTILTAVTTALVIILI